MSRIPNGIPTLSYCRVLPTVGAFGQGDIVNDGNAVVVLEPGQPSARFEVAQVIDKNFDDEEACEMIIGQKAGGGVGSVMNPVAAFVNDAANVVIFLAGSRNTRKWQFLKRIFLPFVANEILTHVAERSQLATTSMYKAQLTVSALEIQDEIISDLLRPANRGLSIITNLEEGVMIQGLHRETVTDEMALRRLLIESCDNRGIQNLPVGGNIDSSTGIFEFRLYQSDNMSIQGPNGVLQTRECQSRLIIIDLPAIDPLLSSINNSSPEEMRLFAGTSLNKSLLTFVDVAKKLNNPYRAQLAPFRASKLTHYVSELIGGNSIVVSLGHVIAGEPATTKLTLELLSYLNSAIHYPLSGREISDTVQGLLTKYRSMLVYSQQEILYNHQNIEEQSSHTQQLMNQIQLLQKETAEAMVEKQTAIEDRMKVIEVMELLKKKYQTILDEKLKQSEVFAEKEEEILALGKTIIEKNVEISQLTENYEQQLFQSKQETTEAKLTIDQLQQQITAAKQEIEKFEKELALQKEIITQNHQEILKWKEDLLSKTKEYQDLKEKNLEISTELLTLINQKEVYLKELESLREQQSQIQQMKQAYEDRIAALEAESKQLLTKLVEKDEELTALHKEMNIMIAKAKEEAAASALAAIESKSREKISKTKSLDQAINQSKEAEEEEETDKGPSKHGAEIARRMINAMKISVEEKKEKLLLKQLYDWETKCHRLEYDMSLQQQLLLSTQQENQELRDKYSVKLREAIEQPLASSNPIGGGEAVSVNENAMNDALSNLLLHYETIVDQSQQKQDFLYEITHDTIHHYRELYDHYHTMLDNLDAISHLFSDYANVVSKFMNSSNRSNNNTNNTTEKKLLIESKMKMILDNALKEQYQLSVQKLSAETEWLEAQQQQEKLQQLQQKEKMKKQMIEEKEKIAAIINTYQRNLQIAETKNVKLQQEMIDLQIHINQLLTKQSTAAPAESKRKEEERDQAPETQVPESINSHLDKATISEAVLAADKVMYENLTNEIRELKQLILQHDNLPGGSGSREKVSSSLAGLSRKPSSQLIEVLKDVISGKSSGKHTPQPPALSKEGVSGGLLSGRSTTSAGIADQQSRNLEKSEPDTKERKEKEVINRDERFMDGNILQLPVLSPNDNKMASPRPTAVNRKASDGIGPVSQSLLPPAMKPEPPSLLKAQLIEAEEKIVQMSSKQMALEEELRSYQNYMKEIIPQYQKQIKVLQQKQKLQQQQLKEQNPTKSSGNQPSESEGGTKLPPVLK